MTKIALIAAIAAVVAYQAATTSASATPVTYELQDVTAKFDNETETDYFSGTFTYDAATTDLSAVAITVSGPVYPGFYTLPGNRIFNNQIQFSDASDTWIMSFFDVLNVSPDGLSAVYDDFNTDTDCPSGACPATNGVTGAAVVPEPGSLALFGAALLGLGGWLLLHHAKRSALIA